MIVFDDGELEIVLVTYNRPKCVDEWLGLYLNDVIDRNIKFTISDSSEKNDTKNIVENVNRDVDNYIRYKRINSNISIGEKPVLALVESCCKYTWICVDRRCADFIELDKYIFPKIRERKYDTLLIPEEKDKEFEREYNEMNLFVHDGLWAMTHLGDIIYRNEIFDELKNDDVWMNTYTEKEYSKSFAFLYFHLSAISISAKRAYIHSIKLNYSSEKTQFSWQKHMLRYILNDLICIINDLPDGFINKEECIELVVSDLQGWIYSNPSEVLYWLRIEADLSEIFSMFDKRGYWDYFSDIKDKINFYANEDIDVVHRNHLLENGNNCTDSELIEELEKVINSVDINNKSIYIYGAGYGGEIVFEHLISKGIRVEGFVDKNANGLNNYKNLPVVMIDEIDEQDVFLIVSLKRIIQEIKVILGEYGFTDNNSCYLCDNLLNKTKYVL